MNKSANIKVISKGKGRIAPTALIIGSGTIILGDKSHIRDYAVIEMDNGTLTLGDRSVIGYHTVIQCSGNMEIGNGTLIGPHCMLLASTHAIGSRPMVETPLIRSTLRLGDNVWIGSHCTIDHGIELGNNSILGANSFLNKSIPENEVFVGSPAKYLKTRN